MKVNEKMDLLTTVQGKQYTEDEDRFLLVKLAHHGLSSDDTYDKIKRDILEHPAFRMDWFFKSRTPTEISRRCQTLISLTLKEAGLYEGKHAHPSAYPPDHKEGELIANTASKKRANPSLSPSSTSAKRAKQNAPRTQPAGPGVTPSVLTPNPYQNAAHGISPVPHGYAQQRQPSNAPAVPFPEQPYPPAGN